MIALSWSRLKTYNECPRKFNLQFISKSFKEEEKSIHLIKGEQLHKQLEDYVSAKNGAMPMPLGFSPEVRQTLPYVDKLFANFSGGVYPEVQIACKQDWSPTEWFAKDTAWRSIWDVTALSPVAMFIGDYKSGKVYPYGDGYGQLHLSAAMGLKRYPDVPEITTAYIYIEHKVIETAKLTREPSDAVDKKGRPVPHLQQVIEHFDREFAKVNAEVKWEPTPNENCKWCPATKGQCKFSRKL
jgi:hypothetical protein